MSGCAYQLPGRRKSRLLLRRSYPKIRPIDGKYPTKLMPPFACM